MKMKRFLMAGLVVVGLIGLSACKKEKPAEEVAGSYKGTLVMSVSGKEQARSEATVVLTAENEEQVTIFIPAMGEGKMSAPELTLKAIPVKKSSDKQYELSESAVDVTVNSVQWKGSIKGSVNSSRLALEYTLQPGSMPMPIQFVFNTIQ